MNEKFSKRTKKSQPYKQKNSAKKYHISKIKRNNKQIYFNLRTSRLEINILKTHGDVIVDRD